MAKLTRVPLKPFAGSALEAEVSQFGSVVEGAKLHTLDIATIQGLNSWLAGFSKALISGNRYPSYQEVNGVLKVLSYEQAYALQEGIPEYDSATTYYIGSIVKKTGTFELYGSLTDDNVGNALTVDTEWKFLVDLSIKSRNCRLQRSANQAIGTGTATAIEWNTEIFDTNEFHSNSVNNTRITIPTGVSKVVLSAGGAFAANATGNRSTYILKNGSTLVTSTSSPTTSAGEIQQNVNSGTYSVTAGDYFEVFVIQSSGGNLNFIGNVDYTFFSCEVIE